MPDAPMPLPDPPEKHLLRLVEAQAKRIDNQVGEIERLWKQVESLQNGRLDAVLRAFRYSQLELEAWLGLWKTVAVAIAVVIVAGFLFALVSFRHTELAELLGAAHQAGAVPAASSASGTAGPSATPGGSAAAASGTKPAPPDTLR